MFPCSQNGQDNSQNNSRDPDIHFIYPQIICRHYSPVQAEQQSQQSRPEPDDLQAKKSKQHPDHTQNRQYDSFSLCENMSRFIQNRHGIIDIKCFYLF